MEINIDVTPDDLEDVEDLERKIHELIQEKCKDMDEPTFFAASMSALSGLAAIFSKAANLSREGFLFGMGVAWDKTILKEVHDDN